MLKAIGRLDNNSLRELNVLVKEIFDLLEAGKKEEAEKKIYEIAKTPNYFIREKLGELFTTYKDQRTMYNLGRKMLSNKIYGIRATALFYFYNKNKKEPEKTLKYLDKTFSSTPWEVESIINDLWRDFPSVMKTEMLNWIESDNESKRALSFHGMENISNSDPNFIMTFLGKAIDDESIEVQKKITHILTQVARTRPAICYPYIREWLLDGKEVRFKTLWVSMKKLVNILIQKSRRDKSQEFIMLTNQTILDWKNDNNKSISVMGNKLYHILQQKK